MWPRNSVELLLSLYEAEACLYNVDHPDYKKSAARNASMQYIHKMMKKSCPQITEETIRKKLHTLRSQYVKEIRASIADSEYIPKLWCYNKLQFLEPYISMWKSSSNIQNSLREVNNSTKFELQMNSTLEEVENSNKWESQMHANLEEVKNSNKFELETSSSVEDVKNSNKWDLQMDSNLEEDPIDINESESSNNTAASSIKFTRKRKRTKKSSSSKIMRDFITNRLMQTSPYDWLGKQVVYQITELKNEALRKDTMWKIQTVLRKASLADNMLEDQTESANECLSNIQNDSSHLGLIYKHRKKKFKFNGEV